MILLRWAALDGNMILASDLSSMLHLVVSGLAVGCSTLVARALVGWTPLAASYLTIHAALVIVLSLTLNGLEVSTCGGAVFASQFGFASGFTIMLGHAPGSEEFQVQAIAGVVLCLTAGVATYLAGSPPPPPIYSAIGSLRWRLSNHLHDMLWNLRGFFGGAFVGCVVSPLLCWALEAGDLTLRVSSFDHSDIPPWRGICSANPKAPGCDINHPWHVLGLSVIYTMAAFIVGEQAVRLYRGEVLEAQRCDKTMREDFEAAYGEETAWEGAWRRGLEGHRCLTVAEKEAGGGASVPLLYGELTPAGARYVGGGAMLDLGGYEGGSVVDIGMGSGKVVLQWFLEHPGLKLVVGVEMVESRFRIAEAACLKLASSSAGTRYKVQGQGGACVELVEETGGVGGRRLQLLLGNACQVAEKQVARADACLVNLNLETDTAAQASMVVLLGNMREGGRVVSYGKIVGKRLVLRGQASVITSWSSDYGHSFRAYQIAK